MHNGWSKGLKFFAGCRKGRANSWQKVFSLSWFVLLLFSAVTSSHAADFLEPEAAFKFSARMIDPKTIVVTYMIADGYYMYRERFGFKSQGATLGAPVIPNGKIKFDETFQKEVETYRKSVTITLPVTTNGPFTLMVTAQGCADQGLCYAPMTSTVKLSPAGNSGILGVNEKGRDGSAGQGNDPDVGKIEASFRSGNLLVVIPLFLVLGLGLSLTPCVLPMVPILLCIIVGEGAQAQRSRGFMLAVVYSLGMALIYTGLGITAGLIGEGLSAALQNPWVLRGFACLMVVLSLSMFGFYHLQIPAAMQTRLMRMAEKQSAGKLFGVFLMGAISALIVGPCVAAPLLAVLLYINQMRDIVVGGSALFSMAMGMSVPLLLAGASAGWLLPRVGAWMEQIKRFFGVLMLAVALWITAPAIPASMHMLGWAALAIGYSIYLLCVARRGWLPFVLSISLAAVGLVQLVGIATGGRDALAPLAHLGVSAKKPEFMRVKSIAELETILASAKGKTALLDFYADWCVSCKEMEKFTFSDPRVQAQFENMLLLQADVTANNDDDKNLLKHFKLFGPPGIIFFDSHGREIRGGRVIGYQNTERFLQSLALVTGA